MISVSLDRTSTLTVYYSVRGPGTSLQAEYHTFWGHIRDGGATAKHHRSCRASPRIKFMRGHWLYLIFCIAWSISVSSICGVVYTIPMYQCY